MAVDGLSGLASGVDTSAIVEKLVALERQPLTRLTNRQSAVTAEQSGLRDIRTKLQDLRTAVDGLRGSALWSNGQTVASSDAAKVAVGQPDGVVPPASVSLRVDALATGAQTRYGDWKPPAAATKLWLGEGVGVSLEAGATVQDAATAINATGKLVYAGVVEGRLVLTSRQTGGGVAAPELREGGDWATGTPWTADRTIRGTNADITVGGVRDQTRTTNDFWLVDQGLHVTLKAPTTTDVTLSATAPAVDKTKIKDKLKAFVTAYNAVVDVVNAKTTEKPVKAPTTAGEAAKGVFFGDTGLLGLMTTLRRQVTERLAGVDDPATAGVSEPDELLDIGISTGKGTGGASSADAKLGKLTIDDAKLDAALADPMAVKALFAGRGAAKGFVERFEATIDGFASTTGMLSSRIAADDGKLRDISSQVARTNARISATETRLKQQFAAMESALGSAQSQQQWLSGQLAALSR